MCTYFGSGFSSVTLYTTNSASVLCISCTCINVDNYSHIYIYIVHVPTYKCCILRCGIYTSLKRVRNMTSCSYILYLYNVHHCTNSAAFSDVVYKHDNALYLGPQPIPPAPFDPDHCRHEIADFYRHHIRPPGEPILIPLLQNTHSISHHCPRYLSLSLLPTLSLLCTIIQRSGQRSDVKLLH